MGNHSRKKKRRTRPSSPRKTYGGVIVTDENTGLSVVCQVIPATFPDVEIKVLAEAVGDWAVGQRAMPKPDAASDASPRRTHHRLAVANMDTGMSVLCQVKLGARPDADINALGKTVNAWMSRQNEMSNRDAVRPAADRRAGGDSDA